MNEAFTLHPRLQADTETLGNFPLCQLLLMKDANFPWCILVPRLAGVTEIFQLSSEDQQQLMRESCLLGEALMQAFNGDKLNIGAIGNLVPQLHVHHIVRYRTDAAWPAPVWGKIPAIAYTDEAKQRVIGQISVRLAHHWI